MPTELKLQLPSYYKQQGEFLNCFDRDPRIRFGVGAWGTKAGKTFGSTIKIVQQAWKNHNSVNWWVAPTYQQSDMAADLIMNLLPNELYKHHSVKKYIQILDPLGNDHSQIWFKSAENEKSLRGFRVHFIVADEMARIDDAAYNAFNTTITETMGKVLYISTPLGHNQFYDLFQRGNKSRLAPGEVDPWPDYFSMNLPSFANPWVKQESIDSMKKNLPDQIFRQEVLAEFLDDASIVFGLYKNCIGGSLQAPRKGVRYVAGVDLARVHDFTVIIIMDWLKKQVVHFERFNDPSWAVQRKRILQVCRYYNNALCVLDATNEGEPVAQSLMEEGLQVYPYKITSNEAKRELIEALRVNIEQEVIRYPAIPELLRELEDYEMKITPAGKFTYSAPRGRNKFDDCVISLALANFVVGTEPFTYRSYSARGI